MTTCEICGREVASLAQTSQTFLDDLQNAHHEDYTNNRCQTPGVGRCYRIGYDLQKKRADDLAQSLAHPEPYVGAEIAMHRMLRAEKRADKLEAGIRHAMPLLGAAPSNFGVEKALRILSKLLEETK